jgi:hypothetical protein
MVWVFCVYWLFSFRYIERHRTVWRGSLPHVTSLAAGEFKFRADRKSAILISIKKGNVSALLCRADAVRGNRISEGSLRFKTRQVFARSVMNIKGRARTSGGNILHDVFITVWRENKGLIR